MLAMLTTFMMLMLVMFMLVFMTLSLMAVQFLCGNLFFNDLSATYNKFKRFLASQSTFDTIYRIILCQAALGGLNGHPEHGGHARNLFIQLLFSDLHLLL